MSFTRVQPGGWSYGAKLTSAQANQLDQDHANALDKSLAGDTLYGTIDMASTAAIAASNPFNIGASAPQAIVSDVAGGIAAMVPSGICAGTQGGISDGGYVGGITLTTAAGLRSGVAGGIQLSGGSSDWISFLSGRSRSNTARLLNPRSLLTGWTISQPIGQVPCLTGPATSQYQVIPLDFLHDGSVSGATLSSVAFVFIVPTSHSGVPTMPTFEIFRQPLAAGSSWSIPQPLNSSGTQSPSAPGSGSAWYNSSLVQQFAYSCNQNNVIDTTQYAYSAYIVDETGGNAIAGNLYVAMIPTFTGITNMAFP